MMDIKQIKEFYEILDKAWERATNILHKFKKLKWHRVEFEIWRATGCRWNRILFVFQGRALYDIRRDKLLGPSGDNFRKEYFKGRLIRTYDGWQNCFIEFCEALACVCPKVFPLKMIF